MKKISLRNRISVDGIFLGSSGDTEWFRKNQNRLTLLIYFLPKVTGIIFAGITVNK